MSKYTRHLGASLMLVGVTLLAACGGGEKKSDSTAALGADTTLNRDLALAGKDTTAQPQLQDVPTTAPSANAPAASNAPTTRTPTRTTPRRTEPRTTTPRPSTPTTRTTPSGNTETHNAPGSSTGGGAVGSIAAGTTLNTHAASRICTNTNAVGDHVTATLENSVSGTNGAVIPAGATVNLTVTRLKRSENSNDPIVMEFAVNSVTFGGHTYPIEGTVASADVSRIKDQPQSKDVQKVAVGAAVGAIAGKIFGKSTKAAVIGGAAGAAAGAAAASATANYQGCIESGHSIVIKLTAPATVKA
ncbi:MAG TPA: hypothetical protein VHB25_09685 [Gemmatimonadaceae bacterium]|nr:hypothetical protein [Gemmatimonadaceae bacterium]